MINLLRTDPIQTNYEASSLGVKMVDVGTGQSGPDDVAVNW